MRSVPAIAAMGLALILAGCGDSENGKTPSACLSGAGGFRAALADAPAQARLGDGTPISECLVENQSGGQLAQVGADLVRVATELRARAQVGTEGRLAATQLGYLVGAVRRGAEETGGIHADLVRRVASAAAVDGGGEPVAPSIEGAYSTGYAAGQRDG